MRACINLGLLVVLLSLSALWFEIVFFFPLVAYYKNENLWLSVGEILSMNVIKLYELRY